MYLFLPFMLLMIADPEKRQFFETLYIDYHRLMYAQALQITRRGQEAQDVVSDSMMALIKKYDLLCTFPCNKLRSYIVITVKHVALNLYRSKKREQPTEDTVLAQFPGKDQPDEHLMEQAGVERIKNALLQLPPREKDIMLMRYFREMSDEEIAQELDIRAVSVRVHLSRARKHLMEIMKEREVRA
ncbi:MAG: sigma-70 family RNA polymerase sigma factor [Clostridiales bacterium]|nr:sigma-70 family RNA polymerase sigma factor [Clostridiales bacterium]